MTFPFTELSQLLAKGGTLMVPLLVLAVAMFTTAFRLWSDLRTAARHHDPAGPHEAPDQARPVLDRVRMMAARRLQWQLHLDRRLRFIRIMAGVAPLMGLLGTVSGMLKTFRGLSARHTADTMDLVATGISEALVTTETGLTFGILALVLLFFLKEYRDRLLVDFGRRENQLLLDQAKDALC